MAKSTLQDKFTSEFYYQAGKCYYELAANMEDNNELQSKIDTSWGMAAKSFWFALTLGSKKAPFSLFKCFGQGVGVKKDADIAALMYGTALKLTPQDCAKIPVSNKPVIDKSMQPRIDTLVKLVKQAHAQLRAGGVDAEVFNDQLTKFNHAIKLPSGKSIQNCFIEKITQDRAKEQDLKFKALELTKNLPIYNKATTNTINHIPKKDKALSRNGCSIL
ncbi:MAG: hypothetical protein LN563_05370 [Rickettsia endosymbiont of Platyusa sonomae]|nr:hypothetical protein [Rickettsia endosymbiont of Platyusa sonomae]